jgi:hypothetical protein
MEELTGTLMERVEGLIPTSKAPPDWGSPRLSVTPTRVAIEHLAGQIEALEAALREIALEVEKLSAGT